jgi:hypothetical protein
MIRGFQLGIKADGSKTAIMPIFKDRMERKKIRCIEIRKAIEGVARVWVFL